MAPAGRTPGADAGDDALVLAARAGDRAAFGALYDRYADRLHGFCVGMLHDRDEAADATHDTFVLAAKKLDQLRDPTLVRPWLYAIARNECIRRGRQRARMVPTERVGEMLPAEEADPAGGLGATEVAALLWAAADGLDERDRLLLELSIRHGLEGTELADAAGIQPGQISMAVGRMRERVERSLGALLIARQGNADCAELGTVLAGWDGTFTVLLRKRVARHVEGCLVCEERRKGLVASMASVAGAIPFLAAPAGLRARVLSSVDGLFGGGTGATSTFAPAADPAETVGWLASGFPPLPDDDPEPVVASVVGRRGSRRAALLAVAAAVIVALVAGIVLFQGRDDTDKVLAAAGAATTTTSAPVPVPSPATSEPTSGAGATVSTVPPTTGPAATSPVGSAPSTATPGPPGSGSQPTPGSVGATSAPAPGTEEPAGTAAPTGPTSAPTTAAPRPTTTRPAPPRTTTTTSTTTTTTTTTTTVPNGPPTLSRVLVSTAKPLHPQACTVAPTSATVSATVTDDRGVQRVDLVQTYAGATTTVPMTLVNGRWRGQLGPFPTAGVVTWQVRATDTDGAVATSNASSTKIERCPR